MTTYAWVNPTNTADIQVVDLDGKPLEYRQGGGERNRIRLSDGRGGEIVTSMGPQAAPTFHLYDRTRSKTTAPGPENHYSVSPSYAFSGTVQQASGLVTETTVWTPVPIGDLYQIRLAELDALYIEVYNQGVTVNLVGGGGTRALRTTQESFANYVSIGSSKLPASTDYTIFDLWGAPFLMRRNDWEEIATGLSLHYTQTNANRQTHDSNMQGLRDTPDFTGLSTYDITTGWPAAPVQP